MKTFNIIIALTIIAFSAIYSPAQRCGGGTNNIHIYVKDGVALTQPRYEIIPVSPTGLRYDDPKLAAFISRTFFNDGVARDRTFWQSRLVIVDPKLVDKFMAGYKFENYDPAPRWRPLKPNNFSGPIEGGSFTLRTGEMYIYPHLLKIYAGNLSPVYILGAHLYGCFPRERIIIDDENSTAYIDSWRD